MIVIDASTMVEALIGRDAEIDLMDAWADNVAAPHLLDVEVLSVLRRLVLAGKLEPAAADQARGLDAPLFTCDATLGAGGHRVVIRSLHRTH